MAMTAKVNSRSVVLVANTIVPVTLANARIIQPRGGEVYYWFGITAKTAADIIAEGLKVSEDTIQETFPMREFSGLVNVVATTAGVTLHIIE